MQVRVGTAISLFNFRHNIRFFYLLLSLPQSERQLDCALDLMRRLPPQQIEKNLSDLIDLVSTASYVASAMFCFFDKD